MKFFSFLAMAACLLPGIAWADITERDLQVAGRTFGFINGIPKGDVVIGIVVDEGNAASKAEADQLSGLLSGGLKVAKNTLQPKLIPVSALDFSGTNVAFVTSGLGAQQAAIFAAASGAKIMTVSTDFSCVDAKQCVMGVASKPKVKIQVSQSAAGATGLQLSKALKLMVTESD
ncbi:YfiR/HmsC family protein [Nisaea sp.]|uniref:YfiR/HmsC family protein n=1 Tax=Nisaea sp. TaxID=2024842 RepID=UPI0032973ABA